MTPAEKALIDVAVKWSKWEWTGLEKEGCDCLNCKLLRAVARVVRERRKGK